MGIGRGGLYCVQVSCDPEGKEHVHAEPDRSLLAVCRRVLLGMWHVGRQGLCNVTNCCLQTWLQKRGRRTPRQPGGFAVSIQLQEAQAVLAS